MLLLAAATAVRAEDCPPPDTPNGRFAPAPDLRGLRVGLALGSGSMHGLAHIGVLQELEARGLEVQVVAGTSVGAVIGSLWASGYTGSQIEALSQDSGWESVGAWAGSFRGLFSAGGVHKQLERLFDARPIESWPRRFGAVATEFSRGERRILDRGDGADAVRASISVPVLYAPVLHSGSRLVDGALVEPVPVGTARTLGADFVIGVDVAYRPYEEAAKGVVQYAFQAIHVLLNALSAEQLRSADFALRMDVHHTLVYCGTPGLIAAGRGEVRRVWPQLVQSLASRAAARR